MNHENANLTFRRFQIVPMVCCGIVFLSLGMCILSSATAMAGYIPVLAGLSGMAALLWPAIAWIRTLSRLERLERNLAKGQPGLSISRSGGIASILARQCVESLRNFQAQTEQSGQRQNDLSLKLQLLEKQKQSIEQIIHTIRDAVVVVDGFDRIVLANSAAEQIFGFSARSSLARTVGEAIDHPEFVASMCHIRQSKLPHLKHELTVKAGDHLHVYDCIFSCIRDEKQEIAGVVAILHDITREKEISQMKNDFVSHVSHELKTPLASINAYAEMLVDGEAQDEQAIHQFCSIIQSQALRLNRLIEDILNISRIESGLIKVDKQNLSMALLMRDAVEMITSYAQEKNITIHTPPAILYDQVHADKDMISQVIINLLSNAVKYTPQGGSVSIESQVNEADGVIRVSVIDTGVGIPPEAVDHVFDKFYRVEQNKKVAKGTGLGLNLVKQIVETVHGGRVFVASEVGKGSTFGFEIPLAAGQQITAKA
ncbi:MAG: PAS domain S-box protein [Sedimentisphaerales bacterium]|nr:PAS domain S-box protein [Sedimentisphaerales bacterium]